MDGVLILARPHTRSSVKNERGFKDKEPDAMAHLAARGLVERFDVTLFSISNLHDRLRAHAEGTPVPPKEQSKTVTYLWMPFGEQMYHKLKQQFGPQQEQARVSSSSANDASTRRRSG